MYHRHQLSLRSATARYLERHLEDAGQVELRGFAPSGRIASGLFDDPVELGRVIEANRESADLYITIQRPHPQAAAPNRLAFGGRSLGNADIGHYIRLPFDLDAVRAPGTTATPKQVAACKETAVAIVRTVHRHGWPLPAIVRSGNGTHLIYRTERMPADESLRLDLRAIYAALGREFDSAEVKFDQTVRNPGRILRVPGSINHKGGEAREVTVELPSKCRQVTRRDIERLARFYRLPETKPIEPASERSSPHFVSSGSGDYRSLDVVAWFTAHGHYRHHLERHIHAVRCPWQAEHTTPSPSQGGDTIIFEADRGWPGFFCHHAHCSGRDIRQVLELWGDADQFCARAFERRVAP